MKTCMITGANSGIGRQAAEQIASKGWRVILLCRNEAACNKSCAEIIKTTGNFNVHPLIADLSNIAATRKAIQSFRSKFDELDVLINNAADFDLSQKQPLYTIEGFEKQFTTNVLAPFLLTKELLPMILKSQDGRIINISSQGLMLYPLIKLNFDNIDAKKYYKPAKTYYQNKLALLMNSLSLKNDLKNTNVSVYGVRVTNVKIDINRYANINPFLKFLYKIKSKFSISPKEMATVYTALTTGPKLKGFLYDENLKEVRANKNAYDFESQKKLSKLCEAMLNKK